MERYFSFTDMISTSIIRGMHILGFIGITLGGIGVVFTGFFGERREPTEVVLIGFAILIFGNLLWRLICEAWILFFRIHESLVSIEHNTSGGQDIDEQDTDDAVPDWRGTDE